MESKFGYSGWVSLEHTEEGTARMMKDGKCFRLIECNCWDPLTRIDECENGQIEIQVLSTVPVMCNYWAESKHTHRVSKILNDDIANIVDRYPQRFIGLGTIPMQDEKLAINELERCVSDLGLAGVQIGSNINGRNLSEPAFFPIFEAASDLGASVFVHPWDIMGKEQMERYWLPWLVGMPAETSRAICSMIFGGVFERLPDLRVAFAHGGGAFPATIGRIQHGFDVRPDLCAIDSQIDPLDYLGKFWVDSLVHDIDMLNYLINKLGHNKIAMGSDYPFPLGETKPGLLIESSNFSNDVQEKLLYKNALDWLALPHDQFK